MVKDIGWEEAAGMHLFVYSQGFPGRLIHVLASSSLSNCSVCVCVCVLSVCLCLVCLYFGCLSVSLSVSGSLFLYMRFCLSLRVCVHTLVVCWYIFGSAIQVAQHAGCQALNAQFLLHPDAVSMFW